MVDKNAEKVKCVIDINPRKQNQCIGGSGLYIIKPEELVGCNIENIVVMKSNYIDEILAVTELLNIKLLTL